MTMITPSYLGETIEYSSLHACRSTLEDPTQCVVGTVTATRSEPPAPAPIPKASFYQRCDYRIHIGSDVPDRSTWSGVECQTVWRAAISAGRRMLTFNKRLAFSKNYSPRARDMLA